MIDIVSRLAVLAVPALIGAAVAGTGWWRDLDAATGALNRFAVDVAFPMLIVSGITAVDGDLPGSPLFWLAVPFVDAVGVGLVWVLGSRSARSRRGTASLVGLFPNSAYLGLPLVVGVFGPDVRAAASAWVALQVGIAVAFGPPLLEWSRRAGGGRRIGEASGSRWRHDVVAMLRRPLVLAPILGLAVRAIGGPVLDAVGAVSDPIGRAASPVALFVLGIYCVTHAAAVRTVWPVAVAHVSWRMLGIPIVAFVTAWAAASAGEWSPQLAAVFVALFAMPAGITTFALTLDADGGHDDVAVVAATIVVSSMVALVTIAPTLAVVREVLDAAA